MISGAARFATEKAVFRPALPMSFSPGISEMHMATLTYREQLLHPNWQRRRLDMLNAAGWKCRCCTAEDATLHVHHKRYFKGRMAWEYVDDELDVLCESCHKALHIEQDALQSLLASIDDRAESSAGVLVDLVSGWASFTGEVEFDDGRDWENQHIAKVGLIARHLTMVPGDTLDAVIEATRGAKWWGIQAAAKSFAEQLIAHRDDPRPDPETTVRAL